jgi:hypothetical protein
VVFVQILPKDVAAFEDGLLRAASAKRGGALGWTWYRTMLGGSAQSYVVLLPRDGWAALDKRPVGLPDLAAASYGADRATMAKLFAPVTAMRSETWSYRADLSYFPK